jgi:SPP1 gp7 family putative phage head morphogenesis protein
MQPIRKDPAGFKTTELANARILAGIVDDFEELVLRVIEGTAGRKLAYNEPVSVTIGKPSPLAMPQFSDVDLTKYYKSIDAIEGFIDANAASPAAQRIVVSAQTHGIEWASRNLVRAGLEKPVAWSSQQTAGFGITNQMPLESNAKPFYLPPDRKMIEMYKERVQSEIKGLTSYQSTAIKRAITAGFEKGETVSQITKRVKEVTPMAKNKAITIARTETLAAGNAAAKQRYEAAGVEKVEYIAADDGRQCDECDSKHGNIYNIGDAPSLPIHPNCRCTLAPYREREET